MTTISANDAKQRFGKVMDEALQHPVSITKHGRPSVVMISNKEYEEYLKSKAETLKEEVRKGFAQIENGEFSEFTADEVAQRVLIRNLRQQQSENT